MRHQRKAEIGYVPVIPGGGNLFFQFVNARARRCCCCNATSIRITKSTTTSSRGSQLPVDACSRQTLTPRSNIGCGKLWRKRAVAPRAKRRPLSTRPPSRFRLAASSSSRANVDRHHQMTPRASLHTSNFNRLDCNRCADRRRDATPRHIRVRPLVLPRLEYSTLPLSSFGKIMRRPPEGGCRRSRPSQMLT